MILARDVFRGDSPLGMPVCGKGTELTDSLIARLEHLGTRTVYVVGHPVRDDAGESLEKMLTELDRRFSRVADDPLTAPLLEIYRSYQIRSMGEDGGRGAE